MSAALKSVLLLSVTLSACLGMAAEPFPHGQSRQPNAPLSPAESVARMTLPEDFRAEVVACEPDIVNPVAMTFDERGRIWITESLEYPRRSQGKGRDRVKILEDTDGDGKADKFKVFADGLNIPSGIAVGHGGVWVANAPDILFLRDTNGDGRADTREVVLTGFGRDDTHELPNSLTWGPDGWLYGWNGVFNRSRVTHRGKVFDFTCAIFRIHPRTRDFELFCEGTSNPWGIAWNLEGEAFASACVIDHLWHLTETGYYHRQGGPYPPYTWKIGSIVDHTHQQAAYCGIHFFDSDAYPPEFRERLYMGNIHGNCINVDRLERNGSTYKALAERDFLRANDAWFMPVSQKTGPDGCLYILDWYDRYHCYQDANRDPAGIDRLKGRLYRIRYKDTPRRAGFDLGQLKGFQLFEYLKSANVYDRGTAQRLLSERAMRAVESVKDSARGSSPMLLFLESLERSALDPSWPRKARMHALWARVAGGALGPRFHRALLDHEEPGVRAWGVRASGNMRRLDPSVRERIRELTRDPDPAVRLQVAIAAGKLEDFEPLPVWIEILSGSGEDRLIPHIVWQNLHPRLEEDGPTFVRLITRRALESSPALARLAPRIFDRLLGRRKADSASVVRLVDMLTRAETADTRQAARLALDTLAARIQDHEITGTNLEEIRRGLEPLVDQVRTTKPRPELALDVEMLALSWGDARALAPVREGFSSDRLSEARRLEALAALISAGDPGILDSISKSLSTRNRSSSNFRGQVLASLGRLDDPRVAEVTLRLYPDVGAELQPRIVELLSQRVAWSRALVGAVGAGKVPSSALSVNQVRKLLASKDADLTRAVKAQWGTVRDRRDPQRERVIADTRAFLKGQPGEPAAGQLVFQKVCAQCHKIYGEGQEVGPEITLNGRGSYDQLLSNVFDPSLVIGAAYQATTVATKDGRVLTGLIAEDSPERVVLKMQGGKLETLARKDIEELKVSPLSLMPEDLEKQLTPREIADLFAFITLDKPPTDPRARPIAGAEPLHPRESPAESRP